MPRYKTTAEALKIISNKEQIRNFGVIAHVDHGKCISGESLITLTNGELRSIKELYESQGKSQERVQLDNGIMVDSMDPSSVKIEDRLATAIWNLRSNSIVEIELADGRHVAVTPEHPFYSLSTSGFMVAKKASEIRPGDSVAVAGVLKSVGSTLDELKREILASLAEKNCYFALINRALQEALTDYIQKESGNLSSLAAKESRISLSKLLALADELGISVNEIYNNIEGIEYITEAGQTTSVARLPKTVSEFQELYYLVGLLYGINSCRAEFEENRKFIAEELRRIYISICSQKEIIGKKDIMTSDKTRNSTFAKILQDLFEYSEVAVSLTIPRLVSITQKEILKEFLVGFFEANASIQPERGYITVRIASEELVERLVLLLLRFGISCRERKKASLHSVIISGNDVLKFERYIGFSSPAMKKKLRELVSKTRVDWNTIPINRRELRAVRIALGLDKDLNGLQEYAGLEDGKEKITSISLSRIVELFEKQLLRKSKLSEKASLLELINSNRYDAAYDNNPVTHGIVKALQEDGLVRLTSEGFRITSLGKEMLNIWRSLLANEPVAIANTASILAQWKALSQGEVQFRTVKSVHYKSGEFSVYDLTVPETHTYLANGIIVHNTTTSDSLLAACGMLSPTVAGQALALDYMPLEQQRQMTIKAANVTLYYEYEGKPYVFNMIDTPGHIDFTGKVTRSLRAIDGAVVVVDSVEGVMTQTETVTRQALEERVRPVLYINKIDRLVKELRLTPDRMQSWLANIIGEFNNLINLYAEPEFRDKWKVSIQDNSVAFGSSKDRWGFNLNMAKASGIGFKDVYEAYTTGDPKLLAEKAPLHEAILTMVIKHHPPPHVAQSYRIPKIWKGDLESDIGKSLLSCDDNGPTVMMVTNVIVDPQAGIVATGRLFSGTVRDGDVVYLTDAKREGRVQSVNMYMGNVREIVGALPAGNIPALLGLEFARAGETISSVKGIVPFEGIKYVSEPVVTVAIEAKNPRDLPKLVDALQRMHIEDPNLIVRINEESGETLLSGMGVLHLEIQTTLLQQQGLEIITSPPLINYRETIQSRAGPVMSKSPNKHNKIYIRVEPLGEDVINKIRSGEISETADRKGIARVLRDMGWDSDEARSVVAVDPKGNMLLDQTKGVQFMQESMDSLRAGFEDVMNNGPLAYEYCRGVKVIIHHFVPHEDPAHRTYAQLMPAARRAILGAMLMAQPVLLEPVQGIEIKCPVDLIGAVAGVLSSKRGKLINIEQKEVLAIVEGEIPASETFDLSEVMRGATAGKAVWDMHFKSWSPLPQSLQKSVITQIRKRKGLPEEVPPASDFLDTE